MFLEVRISGDSEPNFLSGVRKREKGGEGLYCSMHQVNWLSLRHITTG